ncbi:MAG: hypothetical protein ACJA08_001470 [Cyclobacteriaceae bacterium]|jgi:hypothetical protein
MSLKQIFILLVMLYSLYGYAQHIEYEGMWRPTLSFRQSANAEDYILGFSIGASTPQRNLITYASFDFRPYGKKIQEKQSGNFYHQYAEKRFFTGIGVEYLHRLNNKNKGVFANANVNYTWGSYGGTLAKPQQGFNVVPRIGLFMSFFERTTFLKLGYEYLDTKSDVLEHRLFFSVVGVIGKMQ